MKKVTMTVMTEEDFKDDEEFFQKFFSAPEKFTIDVHVEKPEEKKG